MKTKRINSLLWRYEGIIREVVIQRKAFATEQLYFTTLVKIQGYINLVQGIKLRSL
jgi:hypothetical protein